MAAIMVNHASKINGDTCAFPNKQKLHYLGLMSSPKRNDISTFVAECLWCCQSNVIISQNLQSKDEKLANQLIIWWPRTGLNLSYASCADDTYYFPLFCRLFVYSIILIVVISGTKDDKGPRFLAFRCLSIINIINHPLQDFTAGKEKSLDNHGRSCEPSSLRRGSTSLVYLAYALWTSSAHPQWWPITG